MRLKSLPNDARVYDVFASRPETFGPFTDACERMMRSPSSLSPSIRELLGTYVSALNACPYCHDVHNEAVKAYGLNGELAKRLKDDPAADGIDDKLRPLFALARKITEGAYRVTDKDIEAATAVGWDDEAIQDTVFVTCLFNFMNRLVSALGIEADDAYLAGAGERLRDEGYAGSLRSGEKE